MRADRAFRIRKRRRGVIRRERLLRGAVAALSAAALCASFAAGAQWKPKTPVEIVVPNSPGGGNDAVARLMQRIWTSQRLVDTPSSVVNKPGGAGNVALTYISQKPGDAHYMSIVSVTQQLNYIIGTSKFRYLDFTPLATLIGDFVAYAVRTDSPLKSGRDMIEQLRKDPASLNIGVTAVGGNNHIALVLATRSAGVNSAKLKTPVFQSSGDSITAMLGGHIEVHVGSIGPLRAHLENGRVRILAVSSEKRLPGGLAQVPTWTEQGVKGTFSTWRGVWGPKGMSAEQLVYWDQVLTQLAQSDEWKQALEKWNWVNDHRTSRETAKYLDALNEQLKEALKEIGLAKNL